MKKVLSREDLLKLIPKHSVVAELGVFEGKFSNKIITINNPSKLFLVDFFQGTMGSGDVNGDNFHIVDLDIEYKRLLKEHSDNPNVKIIKSTTTSFLKSINDDYLDAVYIDADHSYKSVLNDLYLSHQKVKDYGYILGHDYCNNMFPGVVNAVKDFCLEKKLTINFISCEKLPSFLIINHK
jgi:hypothetical protein